MHMKKENNTEEIVHKNKHERTSILNEFLWELKFSIKKIASEWVEGGENSL